MNELKRQKNEIKKLFCLSVQRDIDKWCGGVGQADDFISPSYKNDNYFTVVRYSTFSKKNRLELRRGSYPDGFFICKTNILNFEIWRYVRKLKRYFNNMERCQKDLKNINYLRDGVESIQADFVKEIRKEKLNKIG